MKILNFGSLNIDHVYNVNEFLVAGETAASLGYVRNSGGKGLNQSIAIARSGEEVYHAGCIGEDGVFLKELLEKEHVDTRFIEVTDDSTGHAIIQVDKNGENCILIYGGANQGISREYVDKVLASFENGDILLLQNEINQIPYIIECASAKGMKVVFNPSPVTDDLYGYPLEKVDMFILNEIEGGCISGAASSGNVLDVLTSKYRSSEFVLTLGKEGSIYGKGGMRINQKSYKAKAIDTTAAGDTFIGYLIRAISHGYKIPEALDLASRAATIAVTKLGAAQSIPYLETVRKYKF